MRMQWSNVALYAHEKSFSGPLALKYCYKYFDFSIMLAIKFVNKFKLRIVVAFRIYYQQDREEL